MAGTPSRRPRDDDAPFAPVPADRAVRAPPARSREPALTGARPIDALRAEIDALDDRLHDLLIRRTELASEIGASKRAGPPGAAPRLFRPGREARVLRRLLARHRGPLPREALHGIWRAIIASNLLLQGKVRVVTAGGGPGPVPTLARDHFGPLLPVRTEGRAADALEAVASGAADIAALPFPADGDPDPWWPGVADRGALHVVARIPLLAPDGGPAAALVTQAGPEPSDDDTTLVAVGGAGDAPALLGDAGLRGRALAGHGGALLLAVDGFRMDAAERIRGGTRVVGAYAAGAPGR